MRIRKILNALFALLLINVLLINCKDEETYFISMNTPQKEIFVNEQYQFKLIVQGGGDIDAESVTWSVSCEGYEATDYVSIDQNGVVKALAPSEKTGGGFFNITVKGLLPNGRYALAKATILKRNVSGELLSFALSDIHMATRGKDSVVVNISDKLIQYFPDMKVTTDKPELITPTLVIDKEKGCKVFFQTTSSIEETAVITLTAGDASAQCNVHIGQSLFLSFEPIDLSLGNIITVEQTSLSYLINNGGLDTIRVHFSADPDDEEHLNKIKFNVRAEGGSPVLLVKGQKRAKSNLLYVFVETGGQEGNADIVIESLGKKVTAKISVLDKNLLVVKKVKFKKPEMVVSTNISLTREIVVDPISVLVHWPVQWSSSDENIAVVDNSAQNAGQVIFKQAGVVEITGRVKDKEAVCRLTALLNVYGIELPNTENEYMVGETKTCVPVLTSNFGAGDRLVWSSSNTQVATVTNGKVVALAAGTTTISVSITDDGNGVDESSKKTVTAQKTITVKESTLSDLNFDDQYMYYAERTGSGVKMEVYNDTNNYTFYLDYREGEKKELADKVYTVGQEILTSSTVLFESEGETLTLKSGTISVSNGKATFNLVAQKAATTVRITGTTSLDE